MKKLDSLVHEFEQEAQTTRKMLSIVPEEKLLWRPHPKSMTLQALVSHLCEIPAWVDLVLTTEELDFAAHQEPAQLSSSGEILSTFDDAVAKGKARLLVSTEEDLLPSWTMRNGDYIISTESKDKVVRMCFSQTVHHRAQLGVYLRLLNIPIPGSYGPSADELEEMVKYN